MSYDINPGTEGKLVTCLQRFLKSRTYGGGKPYYPQKIDGKYGSYTKAAVTRWQLHHNIKPDGYAGPITTGRMQLVCDTKTPAPTENTTRTVCTAEMTYDRQDTGYTCGASSLKMILSSHGIYVTEEELARKAGTRPIVGTDPYKIDKVLGEYGFIVKHVNLSSEGWNNLVKSIRAGWQVITLYMTGPLDNWRGNFGHYSPLRCVGEDSVYIYCPIKGKSWHTKTEFMNACRAHSGKSIIYCRKK